MDLDRLAEEYFGLLEGVIPKTFGRVEMKNDGGPAFPHVEGWNYKKPGMSLRDWFVGQALMGLAAHISIVQSAKEDIANWCFTIADAMLAAREKSTGE